MKTARVGQRMTNKTVLVLDHLKRNKTITSWEEDSDRITCGNALISEIIRESVRC